MLRIDAAKPVRFCDGLSRRDFLHAGALSALGLSLPAMQALEAQGAVSKPGEMNCILLFLVGGPSQLDTWDLKPDAPEEIRGPFKPIETKTPGLYISEIFPKLATMTDKVAILRSVYHTAAAVHDTGHQMMQTGRLFTGGIEHPHYGCVVSKLKGSRNDTPPHVLLPLPIGPTGGNMPHGQGAGYLGKTYDPFLINADPNSKTFKVPDLLPPDYVTAVRENRRRSLRSAIDGAVGAFEASADAKLLDANFENAYRLMSSPKAREAFDLAAEPTDLRDRYGRTRFGQSCLLARRLVEAGVTFVTIAEGNWDHHAAVAQSCRAQVPPMDAAVSTLVEDLHDRGLADSVLVLVWGEFGRTPRLNGSGGRDHWPGSMSAMMAGGGLRMGQVIGATNRKGEQPTERALRPEDVIRTVYHVLGVDPHHEFPNESGRPMAVMNAGRPIAELI